jgi:hypothetical protein
LKIDQEGSWISNSPCFEFDAEFGINNIRHANSQWKSGHSIREAQAEAIIFDQKISFLSTF